MTCVEPGDRIAVTGASGFVGQTLVEHLSSCGYEVVGISERPEPPSNIGQSLHEYFCADLTLGWPDVGRLKGLVHLAGLASIGPSFERPQDYITSNSSMVTHLFEHALRKGWTGRAIIVSSGAVYDSARSCRGGFTEDSPLAATSPYVVSKLLVENQAEYYRRRGIDALVVRPFNHIGPRQGPGFIVPDLAAKVIDWQPDTTLITGNLDSTRDFTDVRDIARAYRLLLEKSKPSYATYNVCSGSARSGWEVLEGVCSALGSAIPPIKAGASRSLDPPVITGNADRLASETGWSSTIAFQTSICDFVKTRRRV